MNGSSQFSCFGARGIGHLYHYRLFLGVGVHNLPGIPREISYLAKGSSLEKGPSVNH